MNPKKKKKHNEGSCNLVTMWLSAMHSIPAATTTPSAMATAVADAIATAIAATAVAAFPGGMSLPALAVPVVFGVVAAALTHPWLVIEKHLNPDPNIWIYEARSGLRKDDSNCKYEGTSVLKAWWDINWDW